MRALLMRLLVIRPTNWRFAKELTFALPQPQLTPDRTAPWARTIVGERLAG